MKDTWIALRKGKSQFSITGNRQHFKVEPALYGHKNVVVSVIDQMGFFGRMMYQYGYATGRKDSVEVMIFAADRFGKVIDYSDLYVEHREDDISPSEFMKQIGYQVK